MIFIHEVHALEATKVREYESLLRDEWAPALAREPGTRLVWVARTLPGAASWPEFVTLIAVADGATLEGLGGRIRQGDLCETATLLAAVRLGLTQRLLANLEFSTYSPDLGAEGAPSEERSGELYIHDFVEPRIGMQRAYEKAMTQVYLRALEAEYLDFVMWAGFQTICGGGSVPENVMVTGVRSPEAATTLLAKGNPREEIKPGTWLYDALKLRDTWTSRLVRSLSWSPTH